MPVFVRALGVALASVVLVLGGATGTQASPGGPNPSNDRKLVELAASGDIAAIQALNAQDRARYAELSVPVRTVVTETTPSPNSITPSGEVSALAYSCNTATRTLSSYGGVGNKLYSEWLQVKVCGSGSISSYSIISRGGNVYWPGWTYEGPLGQAIGKFGSEVHSYSQYHFRYAVLQVGTIQNTYPCVSLDFNANLTTKASPTSRCGL